MKMGTGNPAGASYPSNLLAAHHSLTLAHQIHLIVRVNRNDAAVVTDNHNVAVAAQLITVNNFALLYGANWRSFNGGDVNAVVKRRATRSVTRVDGAADRP